MKTGDLPLMKPEHLPQCRCGKREWRLTLQYHRPDLTQVAFKCCACKRAAMYLHHHGGIVLLVPVDRIPEMSPVVHKWANKVLLSAWRHGETLSAAPGSEKPSIPPQLPAEVVAYLLVQDGYGYGWIEVNREKSMAQPAPSDPPEIGPRSYFTKVFDAVRKAINYQFTDVYAYEERTKDGFWDWYKYVVGKNTIEVAIQGAFTKIVVTSHDGGMKTKNIRDAVIGAEAPYYVDGVWRSKSEVAKRIEILAPDDGLLIYFLTVIGRESLPPAGE